MAKETVAQRNARFAQEREAKLAQEVAEYPQRLMAVLERATYACFELAVVDNKFLVKTRNEYKQTVYSLAYTHSPNSQEQLQELEWDLDTYEKRLAEAKRLHEVRAEALRKVNELLTQEEREQLGL